MCRRKQCEATRVRQACLLLLLAPPSRHLLEWRHRLGCREGGDCGYDWRHSSAEQLCQGPTACAPKSAQQWPARQLRNPLSLPLRMAHHGRAASTLVLVVRLEVVG
jgi:hypothetical protein